jgi:hypothetical protein
MALTMNQLVVGMFGAPAGNLLAGLEFAYGDDISSAAADFAANDLFPYDSVSAMVEALLDGTDVDTTDALAWAAGQTDVAAASLVAIEFLLTTEDEAYASARAQFENKVEVADFYSTGDNMVTFSDLATSQTLLASVTSDEASVTAITEAPVVVEGSTFTLTTGDDAFTGTAGNDTYIASEANLEGDTDIIVDQSSDDNDTLTITGTAFSNTIDTSGAVIQNVENVVMDIDSLTNVTVNANGINSASEMTVNQLRDGSGATFTINNVYDGSTVVAGTDVNDLDVSTDTAAHSVTVEGGDATGTIAATVTTTGSATVNAASAGTVNVSAASGDVAVDAASATSVSVTGTTGDVVITAAGSTSANSINADGENITVTVSAEDADMTFVGDGEAADDSLTINAGADFVATLEAGDAFETVTVNASAATVATFDTTAADAYVGDANTTFAGNEARFDGKDVTGAAGLQLTTVASSDLTGVSTDTIIDLAAAAGAGSATLIELSDGANVELSNVTHTGGIAFDLEDGDDDVYTNGTLNLELSEAMTTGAPIFIDGYTAGSDDGFNTVNVTVTAAQTGLELRGTSSTTINLSGSKAVTLDTASVAGELNGSAMTGILTATADADLLSVIGGSKADILTAGATSSDLNVEGGEGNDTVNVGVAAEGNLDGGNGTDTLNVTAAVDLSGATLTSFEVIDVGTAAVTFDEAMFNDSSLVLDGSGVVSLANINQSLDLSSIQFASSAGFTADYSSAKDSTLGDSSAVSMIGSSNDDTLTGHSGADTLIGGDGADTLTGNNNADVLQGQDGADTLYGGAGDDTLDGGADEDFLSGGAGDDSLTGGEENDTFVFDADASMSDSGDVGDVITDFNDNSDEDLIGFEVFGTAANDASGFFTGFASGEFKVLDTDGITAGDTLTAATNWKIVSGATANFSLTAIITGGFDTGSNNYFATASLSGAIDLFEAYLTSLTINLGSGLSAFDFMALSELYDGTDHYLAVAFLTNAGSAISAGEADIRVINLDDHDIETADITFLQFNS